MILRQLPALTVQLRMIIEGDERGGENLDFLDFLTGAPVRDRDLPLYSLLLLLRHTYGDCRDTLRAQLGRIEKLCTQFNNLYGDGPVGVLRVPARINIIGEHVDYVSYLPTSSLTFGSREHDMLMVFRPLDSTEINGASSLESCPPFCFDLLEGLQAHGGDFDEEDWISFLFTRPAPEPHWANYVKGSVFFARMKFGQSVQRGFSFAVDSTIPPGGGASSSSALTVLAGAAIRQVNHIGFTLEDLARDSSRAEWYLGTRGGAMDHNTICLARRWNSVHLSYADSRAERIPLPADTFRWVTFYSHPADKGREIMLEYNERAAVSRLIIPALLGHLLQADPDLCSAWPELLRSLQEGDAGAASRIREVLELLPESLALAQLEESHPRTYAACKEAFPALVAHRGQTPLKVRDLALHHLGEILRVITVVHLLREMGDASKAGVSETVLRCMHDVGRLLNESHQSLRDLYRISTPTVEELLRIVSSDPEVYGVRLMGGGFGGNLLALVPNEAVVRLLESVQSQFYRPQGRNGVKESLVMVSTPGDGLSSLDPEGGYRRVLESFNARWTEADRFRATACRVLDQVGPLERSISVWPVIVAAGKGERARRSGLQVPKPLAPIGGIPAIRLVLRVIRQNCPDGPPPIVIVSPATDRPVREALSGESVHFVVQPESRGTGDAVFWASQHMRGFDGLVLVVWSTQPLIQADTIRRTLSMAALFPEYEMFLPTVLVDRPYAPLRRDAAGSVQASMETHLERASPLPRGETNIGLFLIKSETMRAKLEEFRQRYWNAQENRYERPGGELGFPNEMITALAALSAGVMAAPIADWRETQGIKTVEDLARCEEYLAELRR